MQNNMRDSLVELILQSDPIKERDLDDEWYDGEIEDIADHLLANGVIVPPCKVGNYIYYPWHYDDNSGVAILEVDKIVIKGETLVFILDPESDMPMPCWFSMDDFGKTVFATRDEAERALREGWLK